MRHKITDSEFHHDRAPRKCLHDGCLYCTCLMRKGAKFHDPLCKCAQNNLVNKKRSPMEIIFQKGRKRNYRILKELYLQDMVIVSLQQLEERGFDLRIGGIIAEREGRKFSMYGNLGLISLGNNQFQIIKNDVLH